jgi:hypothetical protein
MLAPLVCLLLAAPAPPAVPVELVLFSVPDGFEERAGVASRLAEGAVLLPAGEWKTFWGWVQGHVEAEVRQKSRLRCQPGQATKAAFGPAGKGDEFPAELVIRPGKGVMTLEVRREAARGKVRVRYEAELRPGDSLLFRVANGRLALVTVGR